MKEGNLTIGSAIEQRTEKESPLDHPGIPYIGLDDVEAHTTLLLGYKDSATMKSSAKVFKKGDVLYSRLRPYLNKVWLADRDGLCSAEFIILPPNDFIDGKFLKYRISARDFVRFANSLNAGDRPRVDFKGISSFILPPFSLAHQRSIVTKIEELFSELDAGEESFKQARKQLGIYRQSLLKQAFEGKLTEQWRADNPDQLEDPETLLARIQQERESRHQQQLTNWENAVEEWEANGKKGKKPAKPRKPEVPDKPSTEHLKRMWSLPNEWQWIQLGIYSFVTKLAGFEYTKFVKYDENGDLKVIKAENAGPNGFRYTQFSGIQSCTVESLKRSKISGGELLVVFVGAGTANVAVVPKQDDYFLGPNIAMARPYSSVIDTRYTELFLRSPMGKDLILAAAKAVAQPSLSMATIRQAPIAIPSNPEQQEIVRLLEEQFTVIEQNEREIDEAMKRSAALRQSILKRAFSGKLVPQDPTDEPASQLLARIQQERSERAAQEAATKATKKAKKTAKKKTASKPTSK